ncbi:hypothetical protein [Sphingobium sp. AP50]|uniref:hypothetical protein n=1 Tax=Sphingobium sp. AP50 TaxID=1884369 RepID=UPI001160BE29|nr:hypothetical protein [Sphingobium sp. AP50]
MLPAALVACAKISDPPGMIGDPPEYLAANYYRGPADIRKVVPDGKGMIIALSYFTEAQMRDARWEFSRVQMTDGFMCGTNVDIVRRDIRWYNPTPVSKVACAKVVYSLYCKPEAYWGTDYDHILPEAFDDDVAKVLAAPISSPIPENCGEKDGYARWEKEVAEKNPSLVQPTMLELRQKEVERLAKVTLQNIDPPKTPYAEIALRDISIRNVICRPQSLKGFYCKYELKIDYEGHPDKGKWTVRRIVMIAPAGVWHQSEYL